MPIGPDTDRQGVGRSTDRNLHWEDTSMTAVDGRTIPEFRHQGEDFEYIATYDPHSAGEGSGTPWVSMIFDDSGRYSPVSGHATDLADAKSLAVAYHDNEWQPGSDRDTSNPDNPDYAHHTNPEQLGADITRMQELIPGWQPRNETSSWRIGE